MSCDPVRDRLPELALGVLAADEAAEVERHLERCPGCRKEASELAEAAATLAYTLPQATPPPMLAERVARRLGPKVARRHPHRRATRVLLAATLTAALLAVGAVGFAIAERRQVASLQERVAQQERRLEQTLADLARVAEDLRSAFHGRGTTLSTSLFAGPGAFPKPVRAAVGSGLVFALPDGSGHVYVEIVRGLDERRGPFTVRLQDPKKRWLNLGALARTQEGTLLLSKAFEQDPVRSEPVDVTGASASLIVVDGRGHAVLSGQLRPYTPPPPAASPSA